MRKAEKSKVSQALWFATHPKMSVGALIGIYVLVLAFVVGFWGFVIYFGVKLAKTAWGA